MDLIPKVKAQDVDELAVPTIPFTPPGVTVTPSTVIPTGPNISLSTNQFGIGVGETIKIEVNIDTKNQEITDFKFQIIYNPELLEIVDADTVAPNIQISFDNTFFVPSVNEANQTTGVINLSAGTDQGSAKISSNVVASFELRGKKQGIGQVELVKAESFLRDTNLEDILESVNSLSVTVSETTIQSTIPTTFPTKLPDNALIDTLSGPSSIVVGIFLVITGVVFVKLRSDVTKKKVRR